MRLDGGGYLQWEDPVEQIELPQELFLRELFDVDTASDADVVEFLRRFGVIARRFVGLLAVAGTPSAPPNTGKSSSPRNHVKDAALFLKTARALTRHWVAVVEETSITDAWSAEAWTADGFTLGTLAHEGGLWDGFVRSMNEGLKAFTVRVELPIRTTMNFTFTLGEPRPDLYSALCLQLANHIAEGTTVRRCQSETCQKMFVRQQGGARHGQHRTTGVMYCSTYCGNAQWQREHRRKKKRDQERDL